MIGTRRQNGQAGSAIIFVLWMSVLLAVILAGIMAVTQTELRLASGRRTLLTDREALLSALDLVAFDTALVGRSYVASLPRNVDIDGVVVQVGLAPSQNQLDINMANDEAWVALFTYLGEPEFVARRLAEQILDWRDNDDTAREQGAERGDYPEDSANAPQNRPFMSVGELIRVRDMTPQRLACAAPYLTVFGGTPEGELDAASLDLAAPMDGVRVAFQARLVRSDGGRADMIALALFGANPHRPFDWVAFPLKETGGGCGPAAASDAGSAS